MTVKQGTGRPTARGYRLANGDRVPSVTTICSRFKESGGLVHWAWSLGIDGVDYRAARDGAAEAGSICHTFIERWAHQPDLAPILIAQPPEGTPKETVDAARGGFRAFLDWAEGAQLELLETEFPLVSEKYAFGGTPDALALVAGKPKLLDWKSSNAAYLEYVVQCAAYRELIRERGGDVIPDSALLLRVGKVHADFHLHSYTSSILDLGWRYFLLLREAFELGKDLKSVAA
jgi:hypothetical protein